METVSAPEALDMLAEVLGTPVPDADVAFGTLKMDSLQTVEWLTMIEDRLGFVYDLKDLNFHELAEQSVGEVLEFLHGIAAARQSE
ncbi:acyl carrier protein [Embleya sp. NPDC001921]